MVKDENLNRKNRADELRNHYEFMGKAFGKSELSRQTFEDLPFPISVRHLSDDDMAELARMVESDTIKKFPDVAEKMFMLWKVGVDNDEEMEFLNKTCAAAHNFYFDTLRWYAINNYGAKYYCDSELDVMTQYAKQYAKPTKKDMENAIESESNKQSQEQIESAIEDIDLKSAEYKEAADMMEETKRRAEVVELAEKLWLRNLKDLAEYSYYDAFKDAETFIRLKSKYLKEGKIC